MEKNIYAELEKNIEEIVNDTARTGKLDLHKFYSKMEESFERLGFRDEPTDGGIENILILKLDNVGDFILASAAIREIRKNFPSANITLAVSKSIFPMAERCPYVNEVLPFSVPANMTDLVAILTSVAQFCRDNLWKRRFSLAIDLRYFRHARYYHIFMSYLSGAKERKGYLYNVENVYIDPDLPKKQDLSTILYTKLCLHPKKITHDCARNLFLLTAFGYKVENTELELWYDEEDEYKAKKLLEGFAPGKMKIIAGIGGSGQVQKYPVQKYLVAFKKIIEQNAAIIITGGSAEINDAKFLQENLPKGSVLNLVEQKIGWRTCAAIISRADMYIGNDTGVMHCAAASHLPIIYLSRCAKDRKEHFPDRPTVNEVHCPWRTKFIVLQPESQIDDCATVPYFAGCTAPVAHCITQINLEDIVSAFSEMKKSFQKK